MRSTRNLLACAASSVAMALSACGTTTPGAAQNASGVPASIAAPSGNRLAFTLRGAGLQNYECRTKAGAAGGYDWVIVGYESALRDKSDSLVGRITGGPTFEYGDDSKVTGKPIAEAPAPAPASVPWLLLQGTPSPRVGVMSHVTYIQRINTQGGVAPSDTCSAATVGTRKGARYSADYLFFRG